MKIKITARKFRAHDSLKSLIHDEISSLEKHFDQVMSAEVVLSFQNAKDSIKTAEIVLQIPGQVVTAAEDTDDFKKSVTAAVEKIYRQLEKLKNKRTAERTRTVEIKPVEIEDDQD